MSDWIENSCYYFLSIRYNKFA
uniref:Uncharacterized protein n=1 Tax=Rhizophora mucronata TaxID=61149 RepID=A0A2P2IJX1_RHIMU